MLNAVPFFDLRNGKKYENIVPYMIGNEKI